jgi:hypothetical protein
MQCLGGSLLWQEVLALADHFLFKKCVCEKKNLENILLVCLSQKNQFAYETLIY